MRWIRKANRNQTLQRAGQTQWMPRVPQTDQTLLGKRCVKEEEPPSCYMVLCMNGIFPKASPNWYCIFFFLGLKQRRELFEKGCSKPMSLLKVCLRISDPSNKDVESEAIPCLSQLQLRKSPLKGWRCRTRDLVQDSTAPWADTATDYGLGWVLELRFFLNYEDKNTLVLMLERSVIMWAECRACCLARCRCSINTGSR